VIDYHELMTYLSVPRPNGSPAERQTGQALQAWLKRHGIPYQVDSFRLYPYFFECIGFWLITSRTLLALAVWGQWDWLTLPIAILGLLGGTLDVAMNWPLVTWPGVRCGENILIEFEPPHPKQEVIFCAHYDSKTELLDHHQRMFLLKRMNLGIGLTLLLGLWGPFNHWLVGTTWEKPIFWVGVCLSIPMLLLAWGLGVHLTLGRILEPSHGAVDNGSSCAILLGLAHRLSGSQVFQGDTKISLILFTGEEVNMQGSRAYVRSRDWPLPAAAVNLEVMAQDGEYIYWEKEGNVFHLVPTSQELNLKISSAVKQVTGQAARPFGPVNSDGASFLFAGIPTTTIGTLDTLLGESGFHRPSDNLGRVVMARLPQGVEILETFLKRYSLP
jgi:hypothetical protein